MIKYMLTTRCNKKCQYCITKNVKVTDEPDLTRIFFMLRTLHKKGHKDIMLTGGEPTLHDNFEGIATYANAVGMNVFVTSQNPDILKMKLKVEAISFSLHDIRKIPDASIYHTTYACVLAEQFFQELPDILIGKGYKGLTINENQRDNFMPFNESIVHTSPLLSLKINRTGHCMDETIILPNLKVITDFRPYL